MMANSMTQVKFTLETAVVSAFKRRCAAEGVSMASVVREWMKTRNPVKEVRLSHSTRPHRRNTVQEIIALLNSVMESEAEYRDKIPEHFAQRYEDADSACEMLSQAISCLEDAF